MSFRNDSSADSWEFSPRVTGPGSEGFELDGLEFDDSGPRPGAPDDEGLTFVSIDDEDEALLDDDDDEDDEDDDEDDEDEDPFLRLGEDGLDFDEEEF